MFAILRLLLFVLALATLFLITLWLGLIANRRAELTEAWEKSGHRGSHAEYVEAGLARYRDRMLPRLAALIYGGALVSLAVIGYLAS
jgi:hypothetical protein